LLQPVRLALRTLRAKGGLRGCGPHAERGNENQRKKQVWRMHERACHSRGRAYCEVTNRIPAANQIQRIFP
jgi:hypothetical protein